MLLESLRHGYSNLANFNGRESKGSFWVFVGVQYGLTAGAYTLVMMVQLIPADAAMPPMSQGLIYSAITGAVFAMLIAAMVVRRLHDVGRSGWWAWIPVVLAIVAVRGMYAQYVAEEAGVLQTEPLSDGPLTLAYMASVLALIIVCTLKGESEANRYGEPPV